MNHPPRPPQALLHSRYIRIPDPGPVFAPHVEVRELHKVLPDHVRDAPALEEDGDVRGNLDSGSYLFLFFFFFSSFLF